MSYEISRRANAASLQRAPSPSIFGLKFASRLKRLWIGRLGPQWLFDLEYQSWEQIIRRVTSKLASISRRFGLTNLPTTLSRSLRMPFEGMNPRFGMASTPTMLTRCSRRMRGFEDCWFSYRTSSQKRRSRKTTQLQYHGRPGSSIGGRMRRALAAVPIYTNPVWAAGETRDS